MKSWSCQKEPGSPGWKIDLCTALVKHCMSGISSEKLEEVLNFRFKPTLSQLDRDSVLASEANQAAAEGLLEEDDMRIELKEDVSKKVNPRRAKPQAEASSASAQESASSASGSSKARLPMMSHITLAAARQWAPPTSVLGLDLTRHMRWQVTSKVKPEAPYSHSKVFGAGADELSQRAALIQVLKWAWQWHTAATGLESPWRWD